MEGKEYSKALEELSGSGGICGGEWAEHVSGQEPSAERRVPHFGIGGRIRLNGHFVQSQVTSNDLNYQEL